jgi:hypothetical protein
LSLEEAINKVYELTGFKPETITQQQISEIQRAREREKKQDERDRQKINAVFDTVCRLYRMFKKIIEEFPTASDGGEILQERCEIAFHYDFFDRISEKLAISNFETQKIICSSIINVFESEYKNYIKFYTQMMGDGINGWADNTSSERQGKSIRDNEQRIFKR